ELGQSRQAEQGGQGALTRLPGQHAGGRADDAERQERRPEPVAARRVDQQDEHASAEQDQLGADRSPWDLGEADHESSSTSTTAAAGAVALAVAVAPWTSLMSCSTVGLTRS